MRVASGFGAQDCDGDVCELLPGTVEGLGTLVEEGVPGDVRRRSIGSPGAVEDVVVERPRQCVGRENVHAAVTHECGFTGHRVQDPPQALVRRPLLRAATPVGGTAGPAAWVEVEQVGTLGLVEPQSRGQGDEYLRGRAADLAAFDLGVVLDADAGSR